MTATESARLLADVEAFCQSVRPIEDDCYKAGVFNDRVIPLAREHRLLGMLIPVDYGGRGTDSVTYSRALMRIGREGTGVRTFFSAHCSIGSYPLVAYGTPEQRARWLPRAASGDLILAFGLTEPDAGSNPLEMTTTYHRQGDHYRLNGSKYLVSGGFYADAVVTFAYPRETPAGQPRRISAFLVPTAGSTCVRWALGEKMGMPTSNSSAMDFHDHPVPVSDRLGEEGDGFRVAMGTLVSGRLSVAAGCVGVIEDCLAEALTYAKSRHQHGKPIAKHQLVQEHLATIELHRAAAEALILRAAEAKDAWHADPNDPAKAQQADLLIAEAKLFASQAAWDAADRAVQVLGGRGWFTTYRPARHLQDTRVCRIYEGTDEILKLKIAAKLLGREYESFR